MDTEGVEVELLTTYLMLVLQHSNLHYGGFCAHTLREILHLIKYWEKSLLEPDNFWEQVPLKIRSRYHFYNTAMSSNVSHGNSVLRIIEEIATENDFVSFKLDIDSPEHEIPSALHLLRNTKLHSLVDEFFFELHFRCEVYMYCGWGWQLPDEQYGLKLNRLSALELFQNLRFVGIRSHFWP